MPHRGYLGGDDEVYVGAARYGKPYDEETNWEIEDHPELREGKHFPERTIKLKNLQPSQNFLLKDRLKSLFHDRRPPQEDDHPVHIVDLHGQKVIWEGHHRIADAMAKGQSTMKVRYGPRIR